MLEILLHERGSKETGLREFLSDLEETESHSGSWWLIIDNTDQPRGALTVRYNNDLSYLRSVWTRVNELEEAKEASSVLLREWVTNSKIGTKRFQADLSLYSPLIDNLMEVGFVKEKVLLSSYEIETDWYSEDLPEGYQMKSVQTQELDLIYDSLIYPDLDTSSPIYISKDAFLNFGNQLPDAAKSSWVAVYSETNKVVGFGASFISLENEQTTAILYGPHSIEPLVLKSIIAEMLTYWKSKGVPKLRILRVSEFHPNLVKHFKMNLSHETIRYRSDI